MHPNNSMKNEKIFTEAFPNIGRWVQEHGWIEIGSDENSESLVRALNEGGFIWESTDEQQTIDEALAALEDFLIKMV